MEPTFLQHKLWETLQQSKAVSLFKERLIAMKDVMSYYRCALMEVETKFKVLNERFSIQNERNPIESIKSRVKSFESIVEKMQRKELPFTLEAMQENLFDIAGIRVICSFTEDIYMLADCVLQQDDIRLIEKKDYILEPKENGYRSLHLIVETPIFLVDEKKWVKVEIQLRTVAMETWANLEHKLRYKKNLSDETEAKVNQTLFDCAELCAEVDQKMQEAKKTIAGDKQ